MDMFDHPNVFIVEVDNPDFESAMRAEAVNDRPDSPFSVVTLGRRVVSYEKLDNIASQAELQAYADNKLLKACKHLRLAPSTPDRQDCMPFSM